MTDPLIQFKIFVLIMCLAGAAGYFYSLFEKNKTK